MPAPPPPQPSSPLFHLSSRLHHPSLPPLQRRSSPPLDLPEPLLVLFGWAVVKDEGVYQRMMMYMSLSEMGVSRDTQLRALKLLKVVVQEGNGKEIFDFAYKTMRNRWEKLRQVISMSKRFSIEEIPPQFCIFSQKVRGPTPAYAWVKCERKEDKDCTAVLRAANIIGREGSRFAAGDRHVRLSLLKSQDDFDQLIHRLSHLISKEDGTSKTM